MRNRILIYLIVLCLSLFLGAQRGEKNPDFSNKLSPSDRISPRLAQEISRRENSRELLPIWVYFKDKGVSGVRSMEKALTQAERNLAERCLWRRAKVLQGNDLADCADLPVYPAYIEKIKPLVKKIRTTSRWLNAVSAEASPFGIRTLTKLPFVHRVDLVLSFFRNDPPPLPASETPLSIEDADVSFYGSSFIQINQINVRPLHRLGYTGRSVLVCMMDTGFRKSHEIFRQANVAAEWDFVNGDGNVEQNLNDPNDYSDSHGTGTWSILAGFKPGELIGPAYGADFLLAKTETEKYEKPIEEDFWAAGIEWAESLGAEIISSSLGYIDWYTFADMDGRTAVTTRAANRAVSLGVVVVNAAGNERDTSWRHIIAPADGFYVIACGAVDSMERIASFSSPGPTYDGRIKPEVCALGVRNWRAANKEDGSAIYNRGSGTSFATPLVAGAAALLLEIHRDWTPAQVRSAFLGTAGRSNNPDNDFGWGIVDAALAADIGLPSIALEGYSVDDDASGKSFGNGNGRVEPGETIEITVTLKNKGRLPVSGLHGSLSSTHPDFILVTPEVNFPTLPEAAVRSADTPFVVKTPPGFLGRQVSFRLKVEGPSGLDLNENLSLSISR